MVQVFAALVVVALVAGVEAHGGPQWGRHPPGRRVAHHGPPYLRGVSLEGRKEFQAVFRNESLTIAEIDTQTAALAEKYNVSAVYKEFQANVTVHLAEVKKNQTEVINNLAAVASQLETIFSNKNQTRKEQHEAVEALRKKHPVEVYTVRVIRAPFEEKKHRGQHGPRGGPRGGPKRIRIVRKGQEYEAN